VNRTVVRVLHDAVYPSNTAESPATIKLRSILKMPEVTNILQGEKLPKECRASLADSCSTHVETRPRLANTWKCRGY
jgi:hypothetical protein